MARAFLGRRKIRNRGERRTILNKIPPHYANLIITKRWYLIRAAQTLKRPETFCIREYISKIASAQKYRMY